MQWNGLLGSRWLWIAVCTVGVAAACGNRADDDLFEDGGFAGKRSSGGSVATGGRNEVSGGVGGQASGGNGVAGVAAGGPPSSGGKVSGLGGAASGAGGMASSSGNQSSGGAHQGGAKASGGAAVAGSSGGDVTVAGSAQGGSSPAEGGTGGAGAASRTVQIGDLRDAWVDECNPKSRMGSEETLSVDFDPCVFEIYIKPASLSDIPSNAKIESALLELQCIDDIGDPVSVRAVTGEWTEASVNWDNRPSVGDEIGAFTPEEGPVVIDVTPLVQDWLAGAPVNGIALVQQGPETDGSDYYSAESNRDEAPRLLVTYTP